MAQISFRLPDIELVRLKKYCEATGRNQTDVIREMIRRLEVPVNA